MKDLLESLNACGSLFFKVTVAIGVGIVFAYCAFHINYFPTGLTIGDSLIFIFIALGFGVFYSFWVASGFFSVYLFSYPILNRKNVSIGEAILMPLVSLLFLIFLILIGIVSNKDLDSIVISVIAPIFSGLLLLITLVLWNPQVEILTEKKIAERKVIRVGLSIFAITVVPLIAAKPISNFMNKSIEILGVKQEQRSVFLSKDNYKIILDIVNELDIPLYGCTSINKKTILHNVNILWHGIGERTLIELLTLNNGKYTKAVRIELERKGTKVLQVLDDTLSFKTCLTLNTDKIFDTYESKPNHAGIQKINKFVIESQTQLDKAGLKITSGRIEGHSDRIKILSDKDSNSALSKRRAESIHKLLSPLFGEINSKKVEVIGLGSTKSVSNCPIHLKGQALSECLAVDRRVEIVFRVQKI